MTNRPKSPPYRMVPSDSRDEDDDEGFVPHVVLTPSLYPYNKAEKIKEANSKLKDEGKSDQRSTKVRFKEAVSFEDDDFVTDEDDIEDIFIKGKEPSEIHDPGSKPSSKILLVTVPTGFSNESEEVITDDDDCENDNDLVNTSFRANERGLEKQKTLPYANSETSEEDLDESTPPFTEDTLSSSVETVICRSETEDSDLTEFFSKSVNINHETDQRDNKQAELEEPPETLDILRLFRESASANEISLKSQNECTEAQQVAKEIVSKRQRPSTAISVKIHSKGQRIDSENEASFKENKQKNGIERNRMSDIRPSTAPAKRGCCKIGQTTKLPTYNGLRSEYGMTAEQLEEREKRKLEIATALKLEKEKKYLEQKIKRKENELTFNNWLIKKKREAEARALRRLRQNNYCFRTIPAPTAHLDKIGILRRKILKRENTCFLLNEIFRHAKPNEQKTYRIYLGLRP